MAVLAVNFHYVGMPEFPHGGVNSLGVDTFRGLMEQLGRDFDLIGLPELGRFVDGEDFANDCCLVTFDDGLRCQAETALPLLQALGVPAAFFVQTGPRALGNAAATHKLHFLRATRGDATLFTALEKAQGDGLLDSSPAEIDRGTIARHYRYDTPEAAALKYFFNYHLDAEKAEAVLDVLFEACEIDPARFVDDYYMTTAQIREIGELGALGSHGVSHRPLARLSPDSAVRELAESRRTLESWSGRPVEFVSYPFGNEKAVNRSVGEMAAQAGYRGGFTMERAKNRTAADPLLYARIDVLDLDGQADLPVRSRYFAE